MICLGFEFIILPKGKIMLKDTRDAFEYVANSAKEGEIHIGEKDSEWIFYVQFLTNLQNDKDDDKSVLHIADEKNFLRLLDKYLVVAREFYHNDKEYFGIKDDNEFNKKLVLDLVVNATNFQLNNMEKYVEQKTKILQNQVQCGTFYIGNYCGIPIKCEIKKNQSNLEGPYRMDFDFTKDNITFKLPVVTFGIMDNICFIYAVQNKSRIKDTTLAKKLDRHFRKLNKGIDMDSDEAHVSTNALASFALFLSILKQSDIDTVIAPAFLPIRYDGRKNAQLKHKKEETTIEEIIENINREQENMTQKFINLFLRYEHHFENSVLSYDETTQDAVLNLDTEIEKGDNIIYDLDTTAKFHLNIQDKSYEQEIEK